MHTASCSGAPGLRRRWGAFSAPGSVVLIALLLGLMLVVPARRVAALGSVHASPSTGLVDGQSVTVSGGWFIPNVSLTVIQCAEGEAIPAGCAQSAVSVTTNANGGYSTTLVVSRHLVTGGLGTIDCSTSFGRCVIAATDQSDVETTGIGFGTVQASPSAGLVEGRSFTVSGGGFTPNDPLVVNQCVAEATTAAECGQEYVFTTVEADGGYAATLVARRNLVTSALGTVDCAAYAGRCVAVAAEADLATAVRTGLGFGTMQVSPSTGLVDGREITVSGGGFTPDVTMTVIQCASEATDASGCDSNYSSVPAGADGDYSATLVVHRSIATSGLGTVDCGASAGRCIVAALEGADVATVVKTGLGFATMQVSPSTGLLDGRTITVSGGGFTPNAALHVAQCLSEANSAGHCGFNYAAVNADAAGNYSATIVVQRNLETYLSGTVDCATSIGRCIAVALEQGDIPTAVKTDLGFATVQVGPTAGLVDYREISVSGGGYTPNSPLTVAQCGSEPESVDDCGPSVTVTADADGNFSTGFVVYREIGPLSTGPIDCTEHPGRCTVVALEEGDFSTAVPTDVAFATVQASRSAGLVDGWELTVSGGGFTPNEALVVTQCAAEATSADECGSSYVTVTADAAGSYSTSWTASRFLQTASLGAVDCAEYAGRCMLVALEEGDIATAVTVGIAFGTVAASPDANLVDLQTVAVSGGGFTPHATLAVTQCAAGPMSESDCSQSYVLVDADAAGNYSASLAVRRNLVTNGIGTINCAVSVGRCVVVAVEISDLATAVPTAIGFRPNPAANASAV